MKHKIAALQQNKVVEVIEYDLKDTKKESFNNMIEVLRNLFNCIIKKNKYVPKILYSIEFKIIENKATNILLKILKKHDVDAASFIKNCKLNIDASTIIKNYFQMHLESCVEVAIMRMIQQQQPNNDCEIFIMDNKPHFLMKTCTMNIHQIDTILTKIHNEYISSWFEQEVKLSLYVSIFKNFDRNCKDKHSIFKVITILNEIIELQEMTDIIYIEDTNVIDTFLTVLITTMIKELRHKSIPKKVKDVIASIEYSEHPNPKQGEQEPNEGEQEPNEGEQVPDEGEQEPNEGEQELTNLSQLTKVLHKNFPILQPILSDEQNKMLIRCTARYIIDKDYELAQMIANFYNKLKI